MLKKLNVNFVDTCVKPVLNMLKIVDLVDQTDNKLHLVSVSIIIMMLLVPVKNVLTNVPNVLSLNLTVVLVLLTESMPQLVIAQLVLITSQMIHTVTHVLTDVSLVLIMIFVVHQHVLVTECLLQLVIVHQVL
jgi:hypothetical protein